MTGHVAIVTGGLRGLGKAMTLGLLRTGRKVVAVGHISEDIPELQREADGHRDGLHCLALDLRKPAACDELVAVTRRHFGGLDILVNNAGLTFTYTDPDRFVKGPKKFWQLTDEIVQNTMDTNYMVADQLARRVAPILLERGWGRIVNVTTKLDTMNREGSVPYGPSKAALEMATEIWAKELAGTGVTVNIVNPGAGANTPGMAREMRDWSATGKAPKLVEPDEMVAPLLFVVSREADKVHGYRFDANTWIGDIPPAQSAARTGRKAGFELYPLSDCFAGH
ncbi:3-oxoacyl-[acyl-carrier protein] reductase [Enhydrobacter aerosaccus]|uniref:3-oxoacyl-[acyl-carrier protein] reductase n=1 Tax=Enhydrobacter aerosaccus TaxID=225324 RepID=A0A1T4SI24_9HYPH|nr:SDR family oxidoreductase [Enhydrobacter aerosaccus]SKA27837.1 3-oxoacyl-[acyl-carrier protein] reductase [Enhydrobacter aerosaccus]